MVRADNIHESTVEVATSEGFERPPLMNFFIERYMPSYYAEVATFVAAVSDGRPLQPDGASGLQALILAEAAVRSNEGRRTVDVSEI
jgi:myo-inositol 2-dehydrogenase/D-chiro-inositol 1-dehydrogenase